MPEDRFKIIPVSHLILIKDGNILLSRRFNTGYQDGNYSVIAGHLDGNETFTEAMVREAKEEAGLDIKAENLEVIYAMHRKSPPDERIDLFLKANKWQGEPKIMEPDKCDDLQWFPVDNLPANTVPEIKYAIKNIRNKIFYSEFGW